ncbi:MAG: hemolysin-like protein, partial [Chloroflexi bacterium]|nr:hemolysin-like protein [Chloroflexota bacterium]
MAVQVKFTETEAEKDAVYQLRYEIYVEELGDKALLDQVAHVSKRLTDAGDAHARLLMAVDGDD